MNQAKEIRVNGKTYNIKELLRMREQNRANHNLRTGRTTSATAPARMKYALEERVWQAQNTWQTTAKRYGISEQQARARQWQAREILAKLGIDWTSEE